MRNDTEIAGRGRGRPRGFDPADVLQRVRTVFSEKGFDGASLDDLAGAAGLNRPSLYAAFGDKEQLYIKMLGQVGERMIASLDASLSQPGAIEERLTKIFETAIAAYTATEVQAGCVIVNTAVAAAPTHPAIGQAAGDIRRAMEEKFERAFADCVADRTLPADPAPATRARLAVAILDTLAVRARLGTKADDLRALAQDALALICSI